MEEIDNQASEGQLNMYEGGGKNKNRGREPAASERHLGNQQNRFARDDSD